MKKNILYCEANTDSTIGGSYYSLLYLLKNLDRSRFTPKVIFYTHNTLIPEFNKNNISTIVLRKRKLKQTNNNGGKRGHLRAKLSLAIRKTINSLCLLPYSVMLNAIFIKKNKIDLLHLNNGIKGNQEWMIAGLLTRTPCITHQRGIFQNYSIFDLWLAKKLKNIICVSDAVKDNLLEHSFPPSNLVTIYNAIDPSMMTINTTPEALKSKYNIPLATKTLGLLGNLREWKGQEVAIRAMPDVLIKHPKTILMLVGDSSVGDKKYVRHLKQIIHQLKIENHVIFIGHAQNVANYINIMDIVLHTSTHPEPFGRVIIEGMYLKKPIIGPQLGGVPEIITDTKTGLIFEPGNHVSLARSINLLLSNFAWSKKLGENGFNRVHENFHIHDNALKTQCIYTNILSPQQNETVN